MTTLQTVKGHYDRLFAGSSDAQNSVEALFNEAALAKLGFRDPDKAVHIIQAWHEGRLSATRSDHSRTLLMQLTPTLLQAFGESGAPDQALVHFDWFIAKLPAGVQLFALLKSNPRLLRLLSLVLGAAPRLADTTIKRPHVLDALLDPSFFEIRFSKQHYAHYLQQSLSQARDYEEVLDRTRIFAQEQMFLIGVRLLTETMTAAKTAQAYTALAEACIAELLTATWADFATRHGTIPGARLCILGMGKLGSHEMTATSDLDLILLYDFDGDAAFSDGAKPLSAQYYFMRLTQRVTAALSASTAEGALYDIDFRLRPSGNKGPLATQFSSFCAYQREGAWVWEHMALTRARPIAGDAAFCHQVAETIRDIIGQAYAEQPQKTRLKQEAQDMLEKIHQTKPAAHEFDIKTIVGGLIDIEFVAQVLQLEHAGAKPDIMAPSTAEVLQKAMQHKLLNVEAGRTLTGALQLYEVIQQVLQTGLMDKNTKLDFSQDKSLGVILLRMCQMPDPETLKHHMQSLRNRVSDVVQQFLTP